MTTTRDEALKNTLFDRFMCFIGFHLRGDFEITDDGGPFGILNAKCVHCGKPWPKEFVRLP